MACLGGGGRVGWQTRMVSWCVHVMALRIKAGRVTRCFSVPLPRDVSERADRSPRLGLAVLVVLEVVAELVIGC